MCGNHAFADPGCRQTEVDPVWTVFRQLRTGEQQQAPCVFIHGFPVQNISRKLRLFFQDPHELHRRELLPAVALFREIRTDLQEFRPALRLQRDQIAADFIQLRTTGKNDPERPRADPMPVPLPQTGKIALLKIDLQRGELRMRFSRVHFIFLRHCFCSSSDGS